MVNNMQGPRGGIQRNSNPQVGMGHNKCTCDELMRAIMEADFFALDLQLYLDTHPDDARAVEMHREAVKQYKACVAAFEDSYWPLTARSAGKTGCWDWLEGNFPPRS